MSDSDKSSIEKYRRSSNVSPLDCSHLSEHTTRVQPPPSPSYLPRAVLHNKQLHSSAPERASQATLTDKDTFYDVNLDEVDSFDEKPVKDDSDFRPGRIPGTFTTVRPKQKRAEYTIDQEIKVVRKYDSHIMVYLCAAAFVFAMTRFNIGNAYTAGMTLELKFDDTKFADMLNMFNVGHIAFQFTVALWRVLPPKYFVPWIIIFWGIVASHQCLTSDWSQMMGLRFLLGMLQAVISQGSFDYLGWFYYPMELSSRLMVLIAMFPLANMASGLVAYGATRGDIITSFKLTPWRVILLAGGLPAVLVGLGGFLALPNNAPQSRFLTAEEAKIAEDRTEQLQDPRTTFSITSVLLMALTLFATNIAAGSLPVFMPSMVEAFHTTTASRAQLLTAPPYALAFLFTMVFAYNAKHIHHRGVIVFIFAAIAGAGYILLARAPTPPVHPDDVYHIHSAIGARYAGMFMAATGIYVAQAVMFLWLVQNSPYINRFVYTFAFMFTELGCVVGTRLYLQRPSSSSLHVRACYGCGGAMFAAAALALLQLLFLMYRNKQLRYQYGRPRLQQESGHPPQLQLMRKDPSYFDYLL